MGSRVTPILTMCLALCAVETAADASSHRHRPNILFIMSDDHTTQAMGVYGSRLASLNPTPTIDALAKNGMRFDRVYCNNSICTPSRASIITGQYPQTNGVLDLGGHIAPARQFLPMEMNKAGYDTAMVGKWHLKREPAAFGYYCVLPGQGKYVNPDFRVRGAQPWPRNVIRKPGKHSSDAITDVSLHWLKTGWDSKRPFFLMHHFKAPHDMFQNAKRYDRYLEDVTIPEPNNLYDQPAPGAGSLATRGPDDALVSSIGAGVTKRCNTWRLGQRLGVDSDLKDPAFGRETYQRYLKRYLRCVKGVDDNVKRLLDHLEAIGELDNTVILYTGDQGFFLGEHDLMDKRWMYEEAFRMPFIVHYPSMVKAGSVNDWLINNTDFAPTMLALAGVGTPQYMQGHSFLSALQGRKKPDRWRTSLYYRYWMHMAHALGTPAHFGLRNEQYKLIFFYGANYQGKANTPVAWEFYDLRKDPAEMSNAYLNPEYQKIIVRMKSELKQVRADLNETDSAFPGIERIIEAHW